MTYAISYAIKYSVLFYTKKYLIKEYQKFFDVFGVISLMQLKNLMLPKQACKMGWQLPRTYIHKMQFEQSQPFRWGIASKQLKHNMKSILRKSNTGC